MASDQSPAQGLSPPRGGGRHTDAGSTQMWGQTSAPALMAPDKPQGPLAAQLSPLHPPGAGGPLPCTVTKLPLGNFATGDHPRNW